MNLRTLLICTCALLAVLPATAAADLRAGAASTDITPPVGTPMFAYTARSEIANPGNLSNQLQMVADPDTNLYAKTFEPSRGIHQRLRARTIVLEEGGEKFALVQVDLGGMPYALTQEVLKRISSTGIDADHLLISATHTHSATGPIWPADNMGYGVLGGDLFDPRIFDLTAQGIAESVLEADAALRPAKAGVGSATVTGASRNRAFEPFQRNEDVPDDPAAARAASVDPELTVLRVDDAHGKPIGVWSNFAIHATSFGDGNLLFSGDNPGFAERIAEEAISEESGHREVVNVWTNGAEGDISPDGGAERVAGEPLQYVPNSFASAHQAGRKVAAGTVRAWRAAGDSMSADLDVDARRSFLPFDGTSANGEPVGPIPVLGFGGIVGPAGFCAPAENMAGPGQGWKQPLYWGFGSVPNVVPVSIVRVGPLGIAAFPSEITKQMGERIESDVRAASGGALSSVALAGLTNAYVSYTATPEEYDACHYEGSFTLWGRQQGARWAGFAAALTTDLLTGTGGPAGAPEPPLAGFGAGQGPPPRITPNAGSAVEQPAARVSRNARAVFRWNGGDPSLEAPRGKAFVTLERRHGLQWRPVATEDSYRDTTERTSGDVWVERWQFAPCDPEGDYRFVVRGVAKKGLSPEPYTLASQPFQVEPVAIAAGSVEASAGTVSVRATYPDPGPEALLALPRLVTSGFADIAYRDADGIAREVRAVYDPATGRFTAPVPAGSSGFEVVRVDDGCGNVSG